MKATVYGALAGLVAISFMLAASPPQRVGSSHFATGGVAVEDPGTSNCCIPHGGAGCSDPVCEAAVCDFDVFCCDVEWDSLCASYATDLCPDACEISAPVLSTQDLTQGVTPEDLVAALVGDNDDAPFVSNISYTGAGVAAGLFSGGQDVVGFDNGIILSTGNIANVQAVNGLNSFPNATGVNDMPGDSDLEALIPGFETFDAAVLEFDFQCPDVQIVSFQYVFASEEYNEYVFSSFNDVFGFFVNGQNIALLPGTNTPVAINNVNCGNPYGSESQSNCQYFINNECGAGGLDPYPCVPFVQTEMDGLTVVLTASVALQPGDNHVKLAIADAGDSSFDSVVFIQGESFVCGVPPVDDVTPTWVAAMDGNLYDQQNWLDGITPGPGDSFIFGINPSDQLFTVTVPNFAFPAHEMSFTNQRPIFDLTQLDSAFAAQSDVRIGLEGSGAELTVKNGHISAGGGLYVGGASEAGTLTVLQGSMVTGAQIVEVAPNGVLRGAGTVSSWEGLINRGSIAPGDPNNPIGTLSISTNFMQTSSGSLNINLSGGDGVAFLNHDHLVIEETASLGGTLVVKLLDGFVPSPGNSFTVLSTSHFDPSMPTFQTHYMPALPDGMVMTVEYVGNFGNTAEAGGSVVLNVGTLGDVITFAAPQSTDVGTGLPAGIVVENIADTNGVSANDIVTLLRSSNPALPGSVFILLNDGTASLGVPIQITVGLDPRDLTIADLNGNGFNDIAVANAGSNSVTILFNNGDTTFSPVTLGVGGSPRGIVAGNFRGLANNGIPVLDLAVITAEPNALIEIRNMGGGDFTVMEPPIALDAEPLVVAAGDLDHDGLDDVIVGDVNGSILFYFSEGELPLAGGNLALPGEPTKSNSVGDGRAPTAVSIEDVEGTKDPDVIVTSNSSMIGLAGTQPQGFISVFLNDGNGDFSDGLTVDLDGPTRSLSVWDIDNDGTPDVAVVVEDPEDGAVIRIFRNDINIGDGTLVLSLEDEKYGAGQDPVYVRNGDLNNNGLRDMVSLNASGTIGGLAGDEPPASIAVWLNTAGGVEPPVDTCEGHCGAIGSLEICWCDDLCANFDDCCDDFCTFCESVNPVYCGVPQFGCEDHCGAVGSAGTCWCDELCAEFDDCCLDFCDFCSDLNPAFCGIEEPQGGEGCGQGFWRQPHHHGHWVGYFPDTPFCSVFNCSTPASDVAYGGKSLHAVNTQGGGQLRALGRQAVAALLNATHPGVSYDLTTAQVIAEVNAAIANGSNQVVNTLKDELDILNNQGCPLSGHAFLEPDLNYDSAVDGFDLVLLMSNWGVTGEPGTIGYKGDINHDGLIDGYDMILLLSQWGPYSYAP